MDTWVVIVIVVVALLLLAALALAVRQRMTERRGQRRVEARARVAQARELHGRAESEHSQAEAARAEAERAREEAERLRVRAQEAEDEANRREGRAAATRNAVEDELSRARKVDPDGDVDERFRAGDARPAPRRTEADGTLGGDDDAAVESDRLGRHAPADDDRPR